MDNTSIPSSTGDPGLDAKLDGLDDNLQPIGDNKGVIKTDEQPEPKEEPKTDEKVEESEEKAQPKDEDKDVANTEGSEEVSESDGKEDDEGYAIDDGDEAEEKPKDEAAAATTEPTNLTAEQKYILDGLTPLKVKGTVGSDDKVQEFTVYAPEYLPQGFKYVDDRESATANKAFAMLESKAVERQNEFRNQETAKSTEAFQEAEKAADRADIGKLQRDGDLPKFKLSADDPKFDTYPAAVEIQSILDFKDKKNAEYLEQANAGRPFKHIGFEEAFLMYQRENPKEDTAQVKEDKERIELANRTSGTAGSDGGLAKPRVHSGMGSMDLDRLIEEKTAGW